MRRWFLLCLLAAACESKQTSLPEQTATEIEAQEIRAASADGRFRMTFAVGALQPGSVVYITTRRDLAAEGLASLGYEVTTDPPQPLMAATVATYLLEGEAFEDLRMVQFEGVDPASAAFLADSVPTARKVEASVEALPGTFAVSRWRQMTCAEFACGTRCTLCDEGGNCLADAGYTAADGECRADPALCCMDVGSVASWDDPVASGLVYVVDWLRPVLGATQELRSTADLTPPLLPIDSSAYVLLELAGLPATYNGEGSSVALKAYSGIDADDDPSNNFSVPPGEVDCCAFRVEPQSLTGIPPQARARAPGLLGGGLIRSLAPVPLDIRRTDGQGVLRVERAQLSMQVPLDLSRLDAGRIAGVIPARELVAIDYQGGTALDFVVATDGAKAGAVDQDLDFDGLECVLDRDGDGLVDLCCDGVGDGPACEFGRCVGETIRPIDTTNLATCAQAPEFADGFSIELFFTAVPARIVGVD
ncbi:MAG: hypothetical protein RIT81_12940 [Deltaproteobacteria bacterium]